MMSKYTQASWYQTSRESTNGLILLGNTGVGKSFLGNILSGREAFKHECNPSSVTYHAQFQTATIGQVLYTLVDLPGLLEADQSAVERNKQEIYTTFQQCPNSIVVFVLNGGSGGRIRDEDITAFEALHRAFTFQSSSLVLIMNDLPRQRSANYETDTRMKLQGYCKLSNVRICFLDHINTGNVHEREQLRKQLIATIVQCTSTRHSQRSLIQLPNDELKKLNDDLVRTREDGEAHFASLTAENRRIDDAAAQQRRDHEIRMVALRAQGKGADVTYQYHKRGQPGMVVKTEKDWIPIINGNLTLRGPSNVPSDLEVNVLVHSIKW
jgi:GTP-binding protein EngB required for normal cell division